jgi:hypothetical protein
MTNPYEPDSRAGNVEPDALLERDLTTVYSVPVPDLRLDLCAAVPAGIVSSRGGRPFLLRHWRPMITLAGAAAAIAVVIGGPLIRGGDTTHVSAEEILQRTNAAAEGNAPVAGAPRYHLVAKTAFTGMMCSGSSVAEDGASSGSASTDGTAGNVDATNGRCEKFEATGDESTRTEIWFADSGHFSNSQTFHGVPGGMPSTFGQAVNGDDAWLYVSDDNGLRVVHGSSDALGMVSGLGPPNGKSLADVLGQYGKDGCQAAREVGGATVAGRSAYVIEVRQTPDSCGLGDGGTMVKHLRDGADLGTMTVWVDRETFLPLKAENRSGDGTLIYGYDVTEIQVGGDIPAAAFAYTPPAGAQVTDVTTAVDAKRALDNALSGGSSGVPESGTSMTVPATPIAQ